MNIYVPVPKCSPKITDEVLKSVAAQTVPCSLVVVPSVENVGIPQGGIYSPDRLNSESEARILIQQQVRDDPNDFVGLTDQTIVFINPDAVKIMLQQFTDSQIGAVFNKRDLKTHVRLGPSVWRKQCFLDANFTVRDYGRCMCNSVLDSIKRKWQIVEIPDTLVRK